MRLRRLGLGLSCLPMVGGFLLLGRGLWLFGLMLLRWGVRTGRCVCGGGWVVLGLVLLRLVIFLVGVVVRFVCRFRGLVFGRRSLSRLPWRRLGRRSVPTLLRLSCPVDFLVNRIRCWRVGRVRLLRCRSITI